MSSEYKPIGKSNYLNYQQQIQVVQQHHNPRPSLPETIPNENGELEENFVTIPEETLERLLYDELRCPICLGIFDNTITLSTCLHRFCSACFQRSMRELKSQHGCPQCRAKLSSRRVSKADSNIDQIIRTFQKYLPDTTSSSHHTGALFHANSTSSVPSNPDNATNEVSSTEPVEGDSSVGDMATPSSSISAIVRANSASNPTTTITGKRPRRSANEVMDQEIEQVFEIEKYRVAYLRRVEEFKQRQKEMKEKGIPQTYHYQFFQSSDRNNGQKSRQSRGNKSAKTSSSPSSAFVSRRVFLAIYPQPHWRPDEEVLSFFSNNNSVSSTDFTLRLPYLKVNAELNIGELKQFLQLKLQLSESAYARVEIIFPNKRSVSEDASSERCEQWIVLDEALTVIDAMEALWDRKSELIFFYRLSEKNLGGTVMIEENREVSDSHPNSASASRLKLSIEEK